MRWLTPLELGVLRRCAQPSNETVDPSEQEQLERIVLSLMERMLVRAESVECLCGCGGDATRITPTRRGFAVLAIAPAVEASLAGRP